MAPPGHAEPIDVLRATARDLVSLTTGATGRFDRAPAPGEWTPAMVLSHLADSELVYSVRLRLVVAGAQAQLPTFDEDAWVARFAALDHDPRQALSRWRALREMNLRIFDSLDPEEWGLTGWQAGHGEVSVARMAQMMAAHDRVHLDQLREVLAGAR